jgi:BirA family biotin operon repressor/biotin-[acetyl-CoA-carboxylase] ligase
MHCFVEKTGSTNDDLLALARDGAAEGLWLRAGRQSGGKGRQGRVWLSPPGNLYASTLVRLREADPPAPTLALVAAVALHETAAIHASDRSLRIKWPNDLLLDGAKLAGILLERSGDFVVIGFGVNLAARPEGLDRAAACLGPKVEAGALLELLAKAFERWLGRWRGEGLAPVRAQWLAAAHPIATPLSTAGGDGLFDGLEPSGALRLRRRDGTIHIVHAGDVFLL